MQELYAKFVSNQNKGMIWNLLKADGIFETIPAEKASMVQEKFEQKIKLISMQLTPEDNLIKLDKRVIGEMLRELNEAKTKEVPPPLPPNYNASQSRLKIFESEFLNKKKEFETYNARVPDKIDFSDQPDAPIGSEMDKIVADQIAMREKQLNQVLQTQDKEAASKWIQEPIKLVIGESIEKPDIAKPVDARPMDAKRVDARPMDAKPKKVVFADTIQAEVQADAGDDFMALLKKTPDISLDLLREILDKQNQILALLKDIKIKE